MAEPLIKYKALRIILLGLFGIILLFGFKTQIIDGRKYYRLSEANRIKKKFLPAPRGKIFDCRGVEIANSRPGFYVSVTPAIVDTFSLNQISRVLALEPAAIRQKFAIEKNPYAPVKIAHDIGFKNLSILEEIMEHLNGVDVGVEPVRNYPFPEVFSHLIGYVGEITARELIESEHYNSGDYIGRMGLEDTCEEMLRGTDGIEYVEVDARGREIGRVHEKKPVAALPGSDIFTSLDAALTESTAVFLAGYNRAAAVAIDPKSGGVIVLYSKPGFDPNRFIHGLSDSEWLALNKDPAACMYNRAIMSCYPPGSTFKPFIALAAVDAGMITKDRTFEPCRGSYRYGNRNFGCWKKHGRLALIDAIIHSCDVYFYQLGRFTGIDTIAARMSLLGFGKKTGIDLPQEKPGIMPDRNWFEKRYSRHWTEGHIINLSIGQGDILVTPLQLACAYLVFATKGVMPAPRLLRNTPVKNASPPISKAAVELVSQGLRGVVSFGTGVLARIDKTDVCGKTGTAENPHGEDHSLFVGYAPADAPKILVCVIVENAGHGGSVAAPIAGRIMKTFLARDLRP